MEWQSAVRTNKVVPSAETWMDLEIVIQSEVSQKERNKYCIISLLCGIWKDGRDQLIDKAEIRVTGIENKLMVTKGGANWWIGVDTTVHKIDN